MSYTPGTGGRVLVAVPAGLTVSVTIARASGASLTVYSNVGRTSTAAQPASITANTIFYVPTDETYTVSAKVSGTECAVSGSTTGLVTVDLRGDTQATVSVNTELAQNAVASGAVGDGTLVADAGEVGFYGATGVVQQDAIAGPTGGSTVDAEARAAIQQVVDFLSAATSTNYVAGGIGLTA